MPPCGLGLAYTWGMEPRGETKYERRLAKARHRAERLGIPTVERHIFLCVDTAEVGCASKKRMLASWRYLKRRLRDLGVPRRGHVMATRCRCFGVCTAGPIAVVYPDGTWYGRCDEVALDRIIREHLIGGQVVTEYALHTP